MTSPVLVTGGTGRLGRLVVRRLHAAQCDVRVLTRRGRESAGDARFLVGDLATGEGIEAAVDGAAAIVHCATSSKGDVDATRNLVQAASRVGAPHLVYVSIVGIDHPRCPGWRLLAGLHAKAPRVRRIRTHGPGHHPRPRSSSARRASANGRSSQARWSASP